MWWPSSTWVDNCSLLSPGFGQGDGVARVGKELSESVPLCRSLSGQ